MIEGAATLIEIVDETKKPAPALALGARAAARAAARKVAKIRKIANLTVAAKILPCIPEACKLGLLNAVK
jgi:hypothetical protein